MGKGRTYFKDLEVGEVFLFASDNRPPLPMVDRYPSLPGPYVKTGEMTFIQFGGWLFDKSSESLAMERVVRWQ